MRPGERGLRVRAMLNALANDCDKINRVPLAVRCAGRVLNNKNKYACVH